MAFKPVRSPSARLDLEDIAGFIAQDSPSAAEKFVSSLLHAVEGLADFPELGRSVREFNDPAIRGVIRKP